MPPPRRNAAVALCMLLLTCVAAIVVVASTPPASYVGCYADRLDAPSRALPLVQNVSSEATSVPRCLDLCARRGFEYAGMEYARECYCSDRPPRWERLPEERCNMPCSGGSAGGGDEVQPLRPGVCGGALSLSVYRLSSVSPPQVDPHRPLVCLVMILKDEAHTIASTLASALPAVDCWHVLDTGSSDGTPEVVERWFATNPSPITERSLPGQMHFESFIDYGATRNRVLELARNSSNPIFTLMLSADEQLLNPADLRSFLTRVRHAHGPQHGAYPVLMHTGSHSFDSVRLARVDAEWRYKARVHEYLAPPSGGYLSTYRSETNLDVRFNATDGPRRFQSQFFIRRILEEDLSRNPNDTRSIFYLARTNTAIGNHSEAVRYYDLLHRTSKWDEERYHALVMKALESRHLPEFDWRARQSMLLDAFALKSDNMDALHALAQDHFDSGRFELAYLFALRAVQLPLPSDLHAIENVLLRPTRYLYEYEGQRLLGFAAREVKEWDQCVESFRAVLRARPDDSIVADRIQLCERQLEAKGASVRSQSSALPVPAAPVSSSATPVAQLKGRRIASMGRVADSALDEHLSPEVAALLATARANQGMASGSTIDEVSNVNFPLLIGMLLLVAIAVALLLKRSCLLRRRVKEHV